MTLNAFPDIEFDSRDHLIKQGCLDVLWNPKADEDALIQDKIVI